MQAWTRRIAAVAFALVLLAVPAATAEEEWPLPEGEWIGGGSIDLSAMASADGLDIEFSGSLQLDMWFSVGPSGRADGEYLLEGPWTMQGAGTSEGVPFLFLADLATTGGGSVGGAASAPVLTRDGSTSSGEVSIWLGTQEGLPTFTRPTSEPDAYDPIWLEHRHVTCTEVYGRWAHSFTPQFEEEGWSLTSVGEGTFWLLRTGTASDAFRHDFLGAAFGYRDWIFEAEKWSRQAFSGNAGINTLLPILTRAEEILNLLRNASPCSESADVLRKFVTLITADVAKLIMDAASAFDLDPGTIRLLASIGLRTGALGAGHVPAIGVGDGMAALQAEATGLLNRNTTDGPGLFYTALPNQRLEVNDLTQSMLATGATLNWDYAGVAYVTILRGGTERR